MCDKYEKFSCKSVLNERCDNKIFLIVVTLISCIGIYYFSVICKYGFNILTLLPILVVMLIIIAVLE